MSADTTPVILVTDGDSGPEYRYAVPQAWENAWMRGDEGDALDSVYVVRVFERSPVVSTISDAREALAAYIAESGYPAEYGEQVLDLTRPATNLERHLGLRPAFTFRDLVVQAETWQALMHSRHA